MAPKLLKWVPSIPQHYTVDKSILLVSGCSFSVVNQLNCATSWPGFVLDRCGFDHCIDWSYPGAGNEYIGDSILYHLSNLSDSEVKKYMVIVMWSGIDRTANKIANMEEDPKIGNVSYCRKTATGKNLKSGAQQSADKIFELYNYLTNRSISFVFSFYCNLLYPPYIPKRDTTPSFDNLIDKQTFKKLQELPWIPKKPMDFMFEYGFKHDLLAEDLFHPSMQCSEKWVDEILLPEMANTNLIKKIK